ncbi:hypothetical protein [Methylocystis parvus]|uniref:DUF3035 domain-containing protein n=1 Tax=Methylocystis parvus TaxID=134 RepID=A0A6B8M5D5_9HYPH|nr:hypothetical protein [Methylocystis parvus]QGM97628.1 hypothetical protein F7D14_09240 [Methylocystis parvus]WBJ98439.1 hypothetical protein MMG94_10350 [Methylocystis parvus OBBP]
MKSLRLALIAAAFAAPAMAQEGPSTGGQAIGGLFDALGLRKPVPAPADFVRETRPRQLDYVPLAPAPEPVQAKKNASDLQAAGAALDRAAAENKRRAARVKIPD